MSSGYGSSWDAKQQRIEEAWERLQSQGLTPKPGDVWQLPSGNRAHIEEDALGVLQAMFCVPSFHQNRVDDIRGVLLKSRLLTRLAGPT